MLELNRLYHMDCMDGMKQLPDESVDLIITSPPYNLGEMHHTGNKRFKAYAKHSDNMPECEYQEWQRRVLDECFRILKPNGSMWYNHKNRIIAGEQITPYSWLLKTKFIIKQEVVWFNRGPNFDKVRFYPMTERVYWLAKSKNTKMVNTINHHDVFDVRDWKPVKTDGEHKRAFPVKMATDILSCFPAANVVLDPFMGSGTTAVACEMTNREYIGFELDADYHAAATKRLNDFKAQTRLPLEGIC